MLALTLVVGTAVLQDSIVWTAGPPLPRRVTNNAVVAVMTSSGAAVFSFLGLDSTKRWDGVVTWAFRWDVRSASGWREVTPVPGPGRLAATAQVVGGKVYLLGGYTVAADGAEQSLANVDVYDPDTDTWRRGAPMPVPVDDAVSGVWRDSLIVLVSGWHDRDNVADVQLYDPARDRWMPATPIPGRPVFGHAGGIAGNTIVYVDGVRVDRAPRRFVLERSSWRGEIDPENPRRITWERLPDHPGPALYRAAAAGITSLTQSAIANPLSAGSVVLFAGGTDNPYNYDGIGYSGEASAPRRMVLGYDVAAGGWRTFTPLPEAVMDLRGIVVAGDTLVIVGGMGVGQRVRREVLVGRW